MFKPVKGYEEFYEVSENGEIYSKIKNRLRKPVLNKATGYYMIFLCNPQNKTKECKNVHRIVAETWLDNPENLREVNHKNEDTTDNRVENLEWCSHSYNMRYHDKHKKCCRKVAQIDETGATVKIWDSATEAAKHFPTNNKNISAVCRGLRAKAGGYQWRYA